MAEALTPSSSRQVPAQGSTTGAAPTYAAVEVRRIGTDDVKESLVEGWRDFLAAPTHLVFLAAMYPIIGMVFASAAAGRELVPLLWPLVSGFALVGPVAALGMYELSRRRERGERVSALGALDVFRSPAIGSIMVLGIVLLVVFLAWVVVARGIYMATVGADGPETFSDLVWLAFHTSEGAMLLLVGNLVGFLFAAGVLTMTVVSFPLLLDRNVGPAEAVGTSVRAVLANPVPMALWGLIVAVLLFLGSIPVFIGLAAVMPVLGHATWHLYRRVVA